MDDEQVYELQLDDELAEVLEELADARALKKVAEDREKVARNLLLQVLTSAGATRGITASGAGVTLAVTTRNTVSSKKLQAMYPEVYEDVVTSNAVTTLRLI